MPVIRILAAAICVAILLLSDGALADARNFTEPKHIAGDAPRYPTGPLISWKEGWVHLRMTVSVDGVPEDIEVVGGMNAKLFEDSVMKVVGTWRYNPGLEASAPIRWENFDVIVTFIIEKSKDQIGASSKFLNAYKPVERLIKDGNYEEAKNRLEEILETKTDLLYDYAFGQYILSRLYVLLEDPPAALRAIELATPPSDVLLDKKNQDFALRNRFILEATLGRLADAVETYKRLKLNPNDETDRKLITTYESVRSWIDEGRPILVTLRIFHSTTDYYTLSHDRFQVHSTDGWLEGFELHCNKTRVLIPYEADKSWTVPESWGQCRLIAQGQKGTTVQILEVPAEL